MQFSPLRLCLSPKPAKPHVLVTISLFAATTTAAAAAKSHGEGSTSGLHTAFNAHAACVNDTSKDITRGALMYVYLVSDAGWLTLLVGGADTAGDTALEVVRQERVEERIETAVDVGETGERYLDDDQPGGHRQAEAVLDDEGDVQRQPADGEHGHDHDHHPRHSSLGQRRLEPSRLCCRSCRTR